MVMKKKTVKADKNQVGKRAPQRVFAMGTLIDHWHGLKRRATFELGSY